MIIILIPLFRRWFGALFVSTLVQQPSGFESDSFYWSHLVHDDYHMVHYCIGNWISRRGHVPRYKEYFISISIDPMGSPQSVNAFELMQ